MTLRRRSAIRGARSTGRVQTSMAGKFLSVEEAARRLGVSIDEINHLVDRKELFPMRDGSTIKFKSDEVERVAANVGARASADGEDLSLDLALPGGEMDLSLPEPAAGGVALTTGDTEDDASIFAGEEEGSKGPSGSQTVVPGGQASAPSGALDIEDLMLESIVTASSPSLAINSGHQGGDESGTLAIDLADLEAGSLDVSVPGLSGPMGGSGASGSLAAAADSGLSLEGGDLEISGIDLDTSLAEGAAASGLTEALDGSLAGDAFDLGAGLADEESASVVIPTEESGDSSFFGDAMEDSASVTFDSSEISAGVSMMDVPGMDLVPLAPPFTVWQVVGLVCCTLLLFAGGLVVFDVLLTVRSPQGSPVSSPLLNALAEAFGW